MLLDCANDIFKSICDLLTLHERSELLLGSTLLFSKAAPHVYSRVTLNSEAQVWSFCSALAGPRGHLLAPLVCKLNICLPEERPCSACGSCHKKADQRPYELMNTLAAAVVAMPRLRSFILSSGPHYVANQLIDALAACRELDTLKLLLTPAREAIGGAIRDYSLPRTLVTFELMEVGVPNSLVIAAISSNAQTLKAITLKALRLPWGMAQLEGDYLWSMPEVDMPSLRELFLEHNEAKGVSISSDGLIAVLRHARLTSLTIRTSNILLGKGLVFAEIAQQPDLNELFLHNDWAKEDEKGVKSFFAMIRALPATLRILEIADLEQAFAKKPCFEVRQFFGAILRNPACARQLTQLHIGLWGLGVGHLKVIRRLCPALTILVQVVNPKSRDWRKAFRDTATAYAGSTTVESLGFELLTGTGLSKHALEWQTDFSEWDAKVGAVEEKRAVVEELYAAVPSLTLLTVNGLLAKMADHPLDAVAQRVIFPHGIDGNGLHQSALLVGAENAAPFPTSPICRLKQEGSPLAFGPFPIPIVPIQVDIMPPANGDGEPPVPPFPLHTIPVPPEMGAMLTHMLIGALSGQASDETPPSTVPLSTDS